MMKYRLHDITIDDILIKNKKNVMDNKLNIIGKGGQGYVYGVTFNDNDYALKVIDRKDIINCNHMNEKKVLLYHCELVKKYIVPHFLVIYDIKTVDNYNYILMEKIDYNMMEWLKSDHCADEWLSFLFQFTVSLHVMKKYSLTTHNDLAPKNIFIKKINLDPEKTHFHYNITLNNREYNFYVPHFSKLFIIGDFGHSRSLLFETDDDVKRTIKVKLKENRDYRHMSMVLDQKIGGDNFLDDSINNPADILNKNYSIKFPPQDISEIIKNNYGLYKDPDELLLLLFGKFTKMEYDDNILEYYKLK